MPIEETFEDESIENPKEPDNELADKDEKVKEKPKPSVWVRLWEIVGINSFTAVCGLFWLFRKLSPWPPAILRHRIRSRDLELWREGYVPESEWNRRMKLWWEAKRAAEARPDDSVMKASLRSLHRSDLREARREKRGVPPSQFEAVRKHRENRRAMGVPAFVMKTQIFQANRFWQDEIDFVYRWIIAQEAAMEKARQRAAYRFVIRVLCGMNRTGKTILKADRGQLWPSSRRLQSPYPKDGRRMMSTTRMISTRALAGSEQLETRSMQPYRLERQAWSLLKPPVARRPLFVLGISATTIVAFSQAV